MGRGRAGLVLTGYVRRLDDPEVELAEVGGKAWSLARLSAAGLPVPPGFVLTTAAYDLAVAEHGIAGLTENAVPPMVAEAVRAAYVGLGSRPVAVRSSATAEDLPDLSFAGQQDTFLNVSGADALLRAVRRCWASLWTDRAVAYRQREGVPDAGLSIAVVVQEQVPAESAGVLFTADPVTGADVIVIDSAWGLGVAVVDGLVNADSFRVARGTGEILRRDLGVDQTPSLTDDQVRRLAVLGEAVAAHFGRTMDVEWAVADGRIHLLQARPITTRPITTRTVAAPTPSDPWNDTRDGDFLWTNTNVGEAIPDVMTPATWSMVQVFLTDAMATATIGPYVGWGRIGGRVYLNVSVMRTLAGAVGVTERHYRSLTAEVFGRIPDDLEIPRVPASRVATLRGVAPMGVHALGEARQGSRRLRTYLDEHPSLCRRRMADVAALDSGGELAGLWAAVLDPEFRRVSRLLSATTRSSGASFVPTRQRLQRLVGDGAANALTAAVGSAPHQLASLGLLEGLDELARGEIDRDTFNVTYGHRGPHEFEISLPRPGEDPDWIDVQLAGRARAATSFGEQLAGQQARRRAAWAELSERHPVQARALGRQLQTWARISRDRERARSELVRYLWVLRAYALRAGELTGLGQRIFCCSAAEMVRALNGETLSPTLLTERQRAYEGYCRLPSYPGLIRGRFDPYAWAADPDRRSDVYVEGQVRPVSDTVRGFPGSAGVVVGRVRRLTDAAQGAQLRPREVLVTTVTNVGWTPLFPRAAALVTDVGAPLSHAAIVAREIGIPAVLGCGNATMRLRTGDLVRVDGTAGTVELLDE